MLQFGWLWIFLAIYGVVKVLAQQKEKQTQKAKQQARPAASAPKPQAEKPAPDRPSSAWDDEEDEEDDWEDRRIPAAPVAEPTVPAPQPVTSFDARPLEAHIHTPVMGMEGEGTEGMDCCHEYMLGETEDTEPSDFLPLQEEEENQRAKALLQGVIYSEILGRRPMKRYGGKHA